MRSVIYGSECFGRHRPELTTEQAFHLGTDNHRKKAICNSMAVPVMHWNGKRIAAAFLQTSGAAQ